MRPEDLKGWREAQPFVPFRIGLTDGKSYGIPHRDFLMTAKTVINIGIANDPASGIYDKMVWVVPLHIVRIETLQAA